MCWTACSQENELIKEDRIFRINLTFNTGLSETLFNTPEIEKKFLEYQEALLKENEYLNITYDHPVRAAEALSEVIYNPTPENLNAFAKEASDSKFKPRTRFLGLNLLKWLGLTALSTIVGVLLWPGLPLVSIAIAAAAASLFIMYIRGHFELSRLEPYASVMKATKTGEELAFLLKPYFFSPQPVEPKDPEGVPCNELSP